VNGPLDLRVLVLLLAGVIVGYIAYAHPAVGVALLVAVGVVTLLYLLMGSDSGGKGPTSP
jgi:Flp pilus assembly protein TadB